jgi:chemotaxis signal transduction protein
VIHVLPPRASDAQGAEQRGGVLLRVRLEEGETALGFVPADVARRVTALSSRMPVPGAPPSVAGLALADGAVVTVLDLAGFATGRAEQLSWPGADDWIVPGSDRALVCQIGGFDVALTGGLVVATGLFDAAPDDGVLWRGEVVPVVDVRAMYAHAEAATYALRGTLPRKELGR